MIDALSHGVVFSLGEDDRVSMRAPNSIFNDIEAMRLIRSHKTGIQESLAGGFDCVRDGITIAEIKTLTVAAAQGKTDGKTY
ncbi:MAG: hypothetical protein Q9M20_08800 [Mariprofundaceae bacterium]|nr:hypothetical protein [Mariprofundaceae bacterium]